MSWGGEGGAFEWEKKRRNQVRRNVHTGGGKGEEHLHLRQGGGGGVSNKI